MTIAAEPRRVVTAEQALDLLDDHERNGLGRIEREAVALARTVLALYAELDFTQRASRVLGGIIDRDCQWICEIAGVEMPNDGDADYELAWERARAMPAEIERLKS